MITKFLYCPLKSSIKSLNCNQNSLKNFSLIFKNDLKYIPYKTNKQEYILGISKRVEKYDQFNELFLDYSIMDYEKNIIEKNSLKYKFLDFHNSIFIEKNKRKKYIFASNNKFLNFSKNKVNIYNEIIEDESLILNRKYQDEFTKEKLEELFSYSNFFIYD